MLQKFLSTIVDSILPALVKMDVFVNSGRTPAEMEVQIESEIRVYLNHKFSKFMVDLMWSAEGFEPALKRAITAAVTEALKVDATVKPFLPAPRTAGVDAGPGNTLAGGDPPENVTAINAGPQVLPQNPTITTDSPRPQVLPQNPGITTAGALVEDGPRS